MLLRYCRSFWNSIASVNDGNRLMKQVTRPKSERNKERSVTSFRAFPYMSVKVSSHYVIAGTANNAFAANVAATSPLPALSCDVEFGTGFLPPETDAPKGT